MKKALYIFQPFMGGVNMGMFFYNYDWWNLAVGLFALFTAIGCTRLMKD